MDYLNRNAGAVQAFAAILTVLLALAALIGVKIQIDAADQLQRKQSARDIYREYLNLAMNRPEFTQPNYCKMIGTPQETSYEHFVEYMLYTAEQTISVDGEWAQTFANTLKDHAQYICSIDATESYAESVAALITSFRVTHCKSVQPCN